MPTYIFYNKENGEIIHTHREYYMDSDKTIEVSEEELLKEFSDLLPKSVDIGILSTEESPQPIRGYVYYVDLSMKKLTLVEKPKSKKEAQ